jgi:hypothetical protein
MDTEQYLNTASREDLLVIIAELRATNTQLQQRVAALEGRVNQRNSPGMQGNKPPQQRLGVNLVSLIAPLREEGRLPFRMIQWYLKTVHQLDLSVGGIVQAIHGATNRTQRAVAEVLERVRGSPVVHADETGWRQDGANGYVWTFSIPTERYFLRRGRGKGVVDEVLDESFGGVLVSDFYAAYNHYPGPKQRCWAHLLRDIHELRGYPQDTKLARRAKAIHKLHAEAKAFVHPEAKQCRRYQLALERKLLIRCRPFLDDPLAVQGKLCRRIQRFNKELLVFLLGNLPCHLITMPLSVAWGIWSSAARLVAALAPSKAPTPK